MLTKKEKQRGYLINSTAYAHHISRFFYFFLLKPTNVFVKKDNRNLKLI